MKIKALDALATELVGDGKSPNLYFVSLAGTVIMVSRDGNAAHRFWKSLGRNVETALEDRCVGLLASTEPIEEGSKQLRTYDDFGW